MAVFFYVPVLHFRVGLDSVIHKTLFLKFARLHDTHDRRIVSDGVRIVVEGVLRHALL